MVKLAPLLLFLAIVPAALAAEPTLGWMPAPDHGGWVLASVPTPGLPDGTWVRVTLIPSTGAAPRAALSVVADGWTGAILGPFRRPPPAGDWRLRYEVLPRQRARIERALRDRRVARVREVLVPRRPAPSRALAAPDVGRELASIWRGGVGLLADALLRGAVHGLRRALGRGDPARLERWAAQLRTRLDALERRVERLAAREGGPRRLLRLTRRALHLIRRLAIDGVVRGLRPRPRPGVAPPTERARPTLPITVRAATGSTPTR